MHALEVERNCFFWGGWPGSNKNIAETSICGEGCVPNGDEADGAVVETSKQALDGMMNMMRPMAVTGTEEASEPSEGEGTPKKGKGQGRRRAKKAR